MNLLEGKTRDLMRKYDIRPKKRFGQNFLIDQHVLDAIVSAGDINEDDLVIEIGPGLGILTTQLCKKAGKVIAVELDKKFVNVLEDVLREFNNYTIIQGDILKIDLNEIVKDLNHKGKVKVIANLPYYITTPVIMKLLEEYSWISSIVVMIQKEVAERIVAKPGGKEYGALTIATSFYGTPKKMIDVSQSCFVPQPQVVSSVIRIDINSAPPVEIHDKKVFFRVIRAAFGQRRKTILNCLSNSGLFENSKSEIAEMLKIIEIDENQRPETLSIQDFAHIAGLLKKQDT